MLHVGQPLDPAMWSRPVTTTQQYPLERTSIRTSIPRSLITMNDPLTEFYPQRPSLILRKQSEHPPPSHPHRRRRLSHFDPPPLSDLYHRITPMVRPRHHHLHHPFNHPYLWLLHQSPPHLSSPNPRSFHRPHNTRAIETGRRQRREQRYGGYMEVRVPRKR